MPKPDTPYVIVGVPERTDQGGFRVDVHSGAGVAPLPHVERHSPDGFNWGYGGSGPADLALSILAYATGEGDAMRNRPGLYQDFKWEVVAALPMNSEWALPSALVDAWLIVHAEETAGCK
ncbi:MAG TPA: DUF6166 domain-containing protein [bacterium]|nr:DUF6166 domain-containing protein [bacterium]